MGMFDGNSNGIWEDPRLWAGMSLLGNLRDPSAGMQGAMQAMSTMQRQKQAAAQLQQQREEFNQTNATNADKAIQQAIEFKQTNDLGNRNADIQQQHTDLWRAEADQKRNQEARLQAGEDKWNNESYPALLKTLGLEGAVLPNGAQPTGATQQVMQPQGSGPGGQSPPAQPDTSMMGMPTRSPVEPPQEMPPPQMQQAQLPPGQTPGGVPQPPPRMSVPFQMAGQAPQLGAPGAVNPNSFLAADAALKKREGGFVSNDAGKGPTNQGVNQSANPDLDVKNAPPEVLQARRKQYWDSIGGDNLPPQVANIAYDAAINQGQGYARKLIQDTGGNPALMLAKRQQDYEELAKQPKYAQYLPTWTKRIDELKAQLGDSSQTDQTQPPAQQAAPGSSPTAQYTKAQQVEMIGALQMMQNPATRAAGVAALGKAMEPKFAAPGSIDTRTGQALPNPALDEEIKQHGITNTETARHNLAGEQNAIGQLGVATGHLINDTTRTNLEAPKIAAQTAETQQRTAGEAQKLKGANATDYGKVVGVLDSSAQLTQQAAKLRDNPALDNVTGRYSGLPDSIRKYVDPQGMNAKADLNALGSKVLLNTITALKGLSENGSTGFGQLSNVEGEHLKNSVGSLNQAQTTQQMKERLGIVIDASNKVMDRAVSVYEQTHDKSPYQGLPIGTRPAREQGGEARMSKNGKPLLKLPDGKLVEVQE